MVLARLAHRGQSLAVNYGRAMRGSRRMYHFKLGVIQDLEARGLLNQVIKREGLIQLLERPQAVYTGVDPTAGSLHVGHLLPMLCMLHFHLRGHKVISLIGGATALLGDPSGQSQERSAMDRNLVGKNADNLQNCVEKFFYGATVYAEARLTPSDQKLFPVVIKNNTEWFGNMPLMSFLRSIGASTRITPMLNRESVKSRLDSQQGMSFTEFSYQLLQAYDFHTLYTKHDCILQIGGSDQWGNIIAGVDLITHLESLAPKEGQFSPKVYGLTTPLLLGSHGKKMSKSTGNSVWLDLEMTSPFEFYQHFLRTSDDDVESYLKMFTLLPLERIQEVMESHNGEPEKRAAQHLLATEVTEMIHGSVAAGRAQKASAMLFDFDYSKIVASELTSALRSDRKLFFCSYSDLIGKTITKLAVKHGIVPSNSAARTLIEQGGLYVNNTRVQGPFSTLDRSMLLDGRIAILRAGTNNLVVLCLA